MSTWKRIKIDSQQVLLENNQLTALAPIWELRDVARCDIRLKVRVTAICDLWCKNAKCACCICCFLVVVFCDKSVSVVYFLPEQLVSLCEWAGPARFKAKRSIS